VGSNQFHTHIYIFWQSAVPVMHELIYSLSEREYAAKKEKVKFGNQFKRYKILIGDHW